MKTRYELDKLSSVVLGAAIEVHKLLGPGLLESVYQKCFEMELLIREVSISPLAPVPIIYKGNVLNKELVIDILVEHEIVVELKAIEVILPVHEAQIISYLKLADKRLGFLINFNVPKVKDGFRRFVNNF